MTRAEPKESNPKRILQRVVFGLLACILLVGGALRLYRIGEIPAGLYCDEAANGFDAYSLRTTGKDTWGRPFPLFLYHHRVDMVEPIYTYLAIPFIFAFDSPSPGSGLNPASIRLEAAVVGILTILTLFGFMRERYGDRPALAAAFLLAISPWHVAFSRVAFRGIWVPFFVVLGLWLAGRVERSRWYIYAFFASAGLFGYTYSPVRVYLPFYLLIVLGFHHKALSIKKLILPILLFLLLVSPLVVTSFQGEHLQRFGHLSIANQPNPVGLFLSNFAAHFTPSFLFVRGDLNGRHGIPDAALINPVTGVLVLMFLLFQLRRSRSSVIYPLLLVAAVIPSSLTHGGVPNALRAIFVLPIYQVMAALGLESFAGRFRRKSIVPAALAVAAALAWIIFGTYFSTGWKVHHSGFNVEGQYVHNWWQYGVREALFNIGHLTDSWGPTGISTSIDQAYILTLFHTEYSPEAFHKHLSGNLGMWIVVDRDNLYQFLRERPRAPLIVQPWELPEYPARVINFPDGKPALKILAPYHLVQKNQDVAISDNP